MALNLSQLENVEPFVINTSTLEGGVGGILQNLKTNAIIQADGWLSFGITTVIFLFLLLHYHRKDGTQLFDITRAVTISTGFTACLGLMMAYLGFIDDVKFVIWYGMIFLASLIGTYKLKTKGL